MGGRSIPPSCQSCSPEFFRGPALSSTTATPWARRVHVLPLHLLSNHLLSSGDRIKLHGFVGYATKEPPEEDLEKGAIHMVYHVITSHRGGDVSDTTEHTAIPNTKARAAVSSPSRGEQPRKYVSVCAILRPAWEDISGQPIGHDGLLSHTLAPPLTSPEVSERNKQQRAE